MAAQLLNRITSSGYWSSQHTATTADFLSFFLRCIRRGLATDCFCDDQRFGVRSRLCGARRGGPAKTDAGLIAIGELDAGSFQRSTQRSFISKRYWDFPINDLRPTDCCYADF